MPCIIKKALRFSNKVMKYCAKHFSLFLKLERSVKSPSITKTPLYYVSRGCFCKFVHMQLRFKIGTNIDICVTHDTVWHCTWHRTVVHSTYSTDRSKVRMKDINGNQRQPFEEIVYATASPAPLDNLHERRSTSALSALLGFKMSGPHKSLCDGPQQRQRGI